MTTGATNEPTLQDYASRMRNLVEEHENIATDLRELAKEMRDRGLQAVILKAWVKAMVKFENDGDEKPLKRLQTRTQDAAIYGAALGFPVEGFGEAKRSAVNEFAPPRYEPDEIPEISPAIGGPLAPAVSSAVYDRDRELAEIVTGMQALKGTAA